LDEVVLVRGDGRPDAGLVLAELPDDLPDAAGVAVRRSNVARSSGVIKSHTSAGSGMEDLRRDIGVGVDSPV